MGPRHHAVCLSGASQLFCLVVRMGIERNPYTRPTRVARRTTSYRNKPTQHSQPHLQAPVSFARPRLLCCLFTLVFGAADLGSGRLETQVEQSVVCHVRFRKRPHCRLPAVGQAVGRSVHGGLRTDDDALNEGRVTWISRVVMLS